MRCLCVIAVSVAAAGGAAPPPIPIITAADFQTPHPWAAAYLSNGFFGVRPGESFEALTICTLHGVAVLTVLLLPLPAIASQRGGGASSGRSDTSMRCLHCAQQLLWHAEKSHRYFNWNTISLHRVVHVGS